MKRKIEKKDIDYTEYHKIEKKYNKQIITIFYNFSNVKPNSFLTKYPTHPS